LVPEAVYQETVIEGKKELYEDAFKIEEIIENSNKRKQAERAGKGEQVLKSSGNPVSLGKGEKQALRLYFQEKGDAIISDDRTFLNLLDRYNEKAETKGVPFITPANAIVTMENKGIISNKKAKRGLKQIEEIIRQSSYQAAMEELQSGGE
jgi:glutathione synthase/RimK-type ligase-like ATP-grasp enzyme